ncbi:phage shock protein PspA [Gayadomonas joobiniege]|uniref:phage shock protein PspA n=1 Tax=Gayadomonas joobiniege TaxID=1234606 RepID=UPI000474D532|nr:phage shock protein PspA [Gayadomonas joobiniege]
MGVFSRFADIVSANINVLLDKAEDPEKMLRLIIQEMEDTLVEVRSSSASVMAEKKDLLRRLQRLNDQAHDWQQKAELAVSKGREDLAKAALLERNQVKKNQAALSQEIEDLEARLEKLEGEIHQLQEKLQDAKARQKALLLKHKTASDRVKIKRQTESTRTSDMMQKFDAFERKIDDLDATADSYDIEKQNLKSAFAELEAEDELADELAEIKKKLNEQQTKQ